MKQSFFNNKNNRPLSILLVGTFLLLCLVYGRFMTKPNQYFWAGGIEGFTHYHTAAYHIKYDSTWHFTGIGYPYGEHLSFIDAHGGLTRLLGWFSRNVYPIHDYTVGIFNGLMFGALFFCPLFLFLILRRLRLPPYYSVAAALLIFGLSPQHFRLVGHFSLAYSFFIPLLWYAALNLQDNRKVNFYTILSFLAIVFLGFCHAYYFIIGAIFCLAYGGLYWLFIDKNWTLLLRLILIGIIPMGIYLLFTGLTDSITDRTTDPGGIFKFAAWIEGVFLPNFGPTYDFWKSITGVRKMDIENYNYVGGVGQFTVLILLGLAIRKIIKGQFQKIRRVTLNKMLNFALGMAIIVLFFASAVLFQWFPFLLEEFPILRQFRSLGRVGWIFYYVFTVFSAYYSYLIFRFLKQKNKSFGWAFIVGIAVVWSADVYFNLNPVYQAIHENNYKNIFQSKFHTFEHILKKQGYKANDFQAILPFPSYHAGSAKLYYNPNGAALEKTNQCSYELGLPIAAFFASRTSISQSFDLVQLSSSNLIEKRDFLAALPNEKPLLLITVGNDFSVAEQALLAKATLIKKVPDFTVYKLPLSAFESKKEDIQQQFEQRDSTLIQNGEYWITQPTKAIYFDGFDTSTTDLKLTGKGSYVDKKRQHILYKGQLPQDSIGQTVEVSMWLYADKNLAGLPFLKIEQLDEKGIVIERFEVNPMETSEVYDEWVRTSLTLKTTEHDYRIFVEYFNVKKIITLQLDNFLIRPFDVDVFYKNDEVLLYNGYPF